MEKELSTDQSEKLIETLKTRFESNMSRHKEAEWKLIQKKLEGNPDRLWSINAMEQTGGEPDMAGFDPKSNEFIFFDCSLESPVGRRNVCYDKEGLESRKNFKPESSAIEMAAQMGIEILDEEQYRELQKTGNYDTKTSSWIKTPPEIRKLGGALFADRRYGRVFVYHNSAPSYYGVRAFRGSIKV